MRTLLLGVLCLTLPAVPLPAQTGAPAGPIPVARLEARRQALAHAIGDGIAVLRSAEEKSVEGDYPQDSDFRQDNDFLYLTGLETAESWLVLVARDSSLAEAILYLPPRDTLAERWTGPKLAPGPEATAETGIQDVRSSKQAVAEIRRLLAGARAGDGQAPLYFVRRGRARDAEFLAQLDLDGDSLAAAAPRKNLRGPLGELRQIKDADEMRRLRRAIDITALAQREAMRQARPGMFEYELEAIIEYTFRRNGAERVGFPSIVGAGANSTTLHYDKNRSRTEPGDLVVMDIGAEYGYFSADVTRTIPVSGRFTPRQRDIYNLVLATQQAAIDSVRPGMTVSRLNQIARTYMREHSGDLCGEQTCDRYFVHGLSHWLGMDVHDVGNYRLPLASGMVLTVEPGIYLPAEKIGVRIEDDVLVTDSGHEVLSAGAPRTPEDIERAMKAGQGGRGAGRP
ncbi:MAG: aminopeptidase P N-terminal domain-containing protein [Gemmatimonadales bacterium]